MSHTQSFLRAFTREVCASVGNEFTDNYDERRFGRRSKAIAPRELVKRWVKRCGLATLRSLSSNLQAAIDFVDPYLPRIETLYDELADEESRTLLVKLLAYRVFGHRRVRLPMNTLEYRRGLMQFEAISAHGDSIDPAFKGWKLPCMDLRATGIPVVLYSTSVGTHAIFCLEQYRCRGAYTNIGAEAGDVVLDGGGCWGDTALYFANRVGHTGRVISFECLPTNLEILRKNLDLNPDLKPRVEIIERALWNQTGVTLSYREDGPATKVSANPGSRDMGSVVSISIDDLVAQQQLTRLDLIKMDIEGAELAALKGAKESLRCFRPKLAICVYHRLEDFFDIPDYLDSLGLSYRFFLRHFTIHAEETVLFARAD